MDAPLQRDIRPQGDAFVQERQQSLRGETVHAPRGRRQRGRLDPQSRDVGVVFVPLDSWERLQREMRVEREQRPRRGDFCRHVTVPKTRAALAAKAPMDSHMSHSLNLSIARTRDLD